MVSRYGGGEAVLSRAELGYRADIDGMRALAVIIVILFHLEVSWLPGGFVGVDVFFVISGFLITSLIARRIEAGNFSLIDFYERRFRRIYPNLLIVLAATTTLGWFALMPETYRLFGRTLVWASLSASNFAFVGGGGYFDPDSVTKPLLHTWSLGVEEQFYLVFPWLLILAVKRGYQMIWLIGGAIALSLALSIGATMIGWSASYFLLPTRFWELGIGALVAILPMGHRMTPLRRSALGLAGLAAIIWAALSLSESDSFPGYLALAPTLGAAALIVANGGVVNGLMALPPFAWIGRLSYALYLWHWPLISLAAGNRLLAATYGDARRRYRRFPLPVGHRLPSLGETNPPTPVDAQQACVVRRVVGMRRRLCRVGHSVIHGQRFSPAFAERASGNL